jgi:hypothetical protein
MVTLTRTIGQYLKNKGQSTAIPAVPETKAQNVEEGLLGRAGHAFWRIALQWGIAPLPALSDCRQLEFLYSSTLTPKEKVRLEADLKGL